MFLHEIEAGPASRSYGVQVARLAGMPSLIRQARATLEALEAIARGHAQVDLFAPPAGPAAEPSDIDRALAGSSLTALPAKRSMRCTPQGSRKNP